MLAQGSFVAVVLFTGRTMHKIVKPGLSWRRTCLLLGGLIALVSPQAEAVIWSDSLLAPPTDQVGVMQHVGRVRYSRFGVFGGSCVWVGERWVLTASHGVKAWPAGALKVEFPAHGAEGWAVQAIHLPSDEKVDLALLELKEPLKFEKPVTLDARRLHAGARIHLGGFGSYGPAGNIKGSNRFHWGTNTLDSATVALARFSLSSPAQSKPHEALPAMFDSGSPVFLVEGKRELLSGVVIRVSHALGPNVGDRAVITSLSGQVEWIKQVASDLQWRE